MATTTTTPQHETFIPDTNFYSNLGLDYEAAFSHDPGLAHFLQSVLTFLSPSSQTLDLGCGTGKPVAQTFSKAGHHVIGIDSSPKMIELSRKAVPDGDFHVGDMMEWMPEKNEEKKDAIIASLSLFGLTREQLVELSRKWAEWLAPGGIVCICTIAAEDVDIPKGLYAEDGLGAEDIPWKFMGRRVGITLLTREGWKVMLGAVGLEIVHTEEREFEPAEEADCDVERHWFVVARKS